MMQKILIAILAVVLSLNACFIKRSHTKTDETSVVVNDKKVIKPDAKLVAVMDSLNMHYLNYETLTMKFSGDFDSEDKSTPLKGILRMKRDSFIWISIRPGLGIELARAVFTPDSVKMLNRMKSEYFLGDYAFVDSAFGVQADYKMLEAIITNRFFVYNPNPAIQPDFVQFKLSATGQEKVLTKLDSTSLKSYNQTVTVSSTYQVKGVSADSKPIQRSISLLYSDFFSLGNANFPAKFTVDIKDKAKSSTLLLEFTDHQLDKPMKSTFKVPSTYSVMTFNKDK